MQIRVKVKPNSANPGVSREENGEIALRIRERPIEGAANAACIEALAAAFGVPKSRVRLVHGATSRVKRFEIDGLEGSALPF